MNLVLDNYRNIILNNASHQIVSSDMWDIGYLGHLVCVTLHISNLKPLSGFTETKNVTVKFCITLHVNILIECTMNLFSIGFL